MNSKADTDANSRENSGRACCTVLGFRVHTCSLHIQSEHTDLAYMGRLNLATRTGKGKFELNLETIKGVSLLAYSLVTHE